MPAIQFNRERWNQAGGGGIHRRRIMLNRFFVPRLYPNGYRYTPFVVATAQQAN